MMMNGVEPGATFIMQLVFSSSVMVLLLVACFGTT
jgi:hypothetical protein